jgi:uncharacterized protein YndB with AHSA1/START domain
MNKQMHDPQADIEIAAPPAIVYALLADITRMAEWSPECERCWWIDGATGMAMGARFRGRSRRGRRRWTTTSVIRTAEVATEITWDVTYWRRPVARWRYRLTPIGARGTRLTEAVEDHRGPLLRALSPYITGSRDRASRNAETMHVTLQRVKRAAEAA